MHVARAAALVAVLLLAGGWSVQAEEDVEGGDGAQCLEPREVESCRLQRTSIEDMAAQIEAIEGEVPPLEREVPVACEGAESGEAAQPERCAELAQRLRELVARYHELFDRYEREVESHNARCAGRAPCGEGE